MQIPLGKGNRQDLLRKLGVCVGEKWRIEGEGKGGEEHEEIGCSKTGKDIEGEQGKRYLN